jgi:hypothetical protein
MKLRSAARTAGRLSVIAALTGTAGVSIAVGLGATPTAAGLPTEAEADGVLTASTSTTSSATLTIGNSVTVPGGSSQMATVSGTATCSGGSSADITIEPLFESTPVIAAGVANAPTVITCDGTAHPWNMTASATQAAKWAAPGSGTVTVMMYGSTGAPLMALQEQSVTFTSS